MTKHRLPYLLSQYLDKSCSAAELKEFYTLVGEPAHEAELSDLLEAAFSNAAAGQSQSKNGLSKNSEGDNREGRNQAEISLSESRQAELVREVMLKAGGGGVKEENENIIRPRMMKLWKKIAVTAAAAAAITLGVWLYYTSSINGRHSGEGRNTGPAMQNDIAPGRNTATITFDNGEAVDLNNKELDISSAAVEPLKEGSEVAPETTQFLASRIAKSKMVVLSTPRGGTYQVLLPDGTKAWLNASSSIQFPSSFKGARQRKVEITGEVYLEVAKDKTRPFIVKTDKQEVEVLGTHFNINSYPDEGSTKTTLLEGSVRIAYAPSNPELGSKPRNRKSAIHDITLHPNQQAVLTANKEIKVKQVDPNEVVAWKNGNFVFEDENLRSIMRKIARWYNIEVVYEGEISDAGFTGAISRNKNISQVLEILSRSKDIQFKIEGRRVTVIQ